jgi:hypothetical protein
LASLGYGGWVLPLETNADGSIRIHVVAGRNYSAAYDYNTGDRLKRDIQAALGEEINFRDDFILVLSGLCEKRGEFDYRFFAPYYGDGGSDHLRV